MLTAFVGFGVGGNIPIDTTITLEFIPQNKRFLLATLSIFQPLGVVLCSAIAFAFIPTMSCSPNFSEANPLPSCSSGSNPNQPGRDAGAACCGRANNMGWRYLLFTLGAITLAVFCLRFLVFNFRESPKFLIYQGQDEKAIRVVQHIAKTNGVECRLSLATFEALSGGGIGSDSSGGADGSPPLDPLGSDSAGGSGGSGGDGGVHGQQTRDNLLSGGVTTFKRVKQAKTKLQAQTPAYMMLFSSFAMARLTILVWLTYIMDFWGFTVAGEIFSTFSTWHEKLYRRC